MADDRDDAQQTEEPTQKRLDEAREKGDVVKSSEVQTFILLLGATIAIATMGPSAAMGMAETLRMFLAHPDDMSTDPGSLLELMRTLLTHVAMTLGPLFIVMMIAGLAGNLIQHRPVFSFERIQPDLSKLSLTAGFSRLFGIEGWTNLIKGLLKIAIVGAAVWVEIWPERNGLEAILGQAPQAVAGDMAHLMFKVLEAAIAAMAAVAGADYFLQRFQFMKRNRMSKQEIKEEFRQTEGDPAIKAKIRQLRLEKARKRMIAAVPEATVVIMNPTHYAVALKYESGKMAAPICVAKGVDGLALRIRDVAKEHGVPVVENPPLARALHATVEVDEAIPAEHFKAVAQVIGYVYRLTGKMRAN